VGSAYFYEDRIFEILGASRFDETAIGAENYTPGIGGTELGFTTTATNAGQNPLSAIAASSGARSRVLTHRSRAATTTFTPVALDDYELNQFLIDIQIANTGYEAGDFLNVSLVFGSDRIEVFNAQGSAVDDRLDVLAQSGYISYTVDIPANWTTAQLIISSSSNSTTGAERFDFDNIFFRGVSAVPEPASIYGAIIGFGVLIFTSGPGQRCRRRRCGRR
jgi:hypothetical protein